MAAVRDGDEKEKLASSMSPSLWKAGSCDPLVIWTRLGGALSGQRCWKCMGTGTETVKDKDRKKEGYVPKQCKVCGGTCRIQAERRKRLSQLPGVVRGNERPEGWVCPGPKPAGDQGREELRPRVGEALCSLVGDFKIFQRMGGHRYSSDDVVTAWYAAKLCKEKGKIPETHIDIGCGLGSVLMMLAWHFNVRSIGVEAQLVSVQLAKRSLAYNGLEGRVEVRNGDLRDFSVVPDGAGNFDLVTGTPPYFEFGTAAVPAKSDQKACLFEYRGGIEAYCIAAKHYMAPEGMFVVVDTSLAIDRVEAAAEAASLTIVERIDTLPKSGKKSLFTVFCMMHRSSAGASTAVSGGSSAYTVHEITVRDGEGLHTVEYMSLLVDMGFPPNYSRRT